MARKKVKKAKGFSLVPKKKSKSSDKRAVMGRECFSSSQKSEVNTNPTLVKILEILAKEQSVYVRKVFCVINSSQGVEPSEDWLKSEGLDTTEARNIIKVAKGIYDSRKELVENQYIPETISDIRSIKKRISNTTDKLVKAKTKKRVSKLKVRLIKLRDKLNRRIQHLAVLENQLLTGKFSVCFGSKKLAREFNNSLKVYRSENDTKIKCEALKSYEAKKAQWQLVRDSELFYEGHAVQRAGNQKIKLTPNGDLFDLEIAIPPRHREEISKFATINKGFVVFEGISFGTTRNQKDLQKALEPVIKESVKKNGSVDKRSSTAYPVTHRLKLVDKNGVMGAQLITTIKIKKAYIVSTRLNGALGVDINQHSLDWSLVDYYGNYVASGTIPLSTQDKNNNQTTDLISKAATELIRLAVEYKVPLILENLQFKKNTENFSGKGKKFARMASNLPFAQIRDTLLQKSYRFGVIVKFVNPAFTSVIGLYKYMVPYGLNSGTAAGIVIARRGLGFAEKIPSYVFSTGFSLEDGISDKSWKAWGKLAKSRKTVGGVNRHQFYTFSRLRGVNCSDEDGCVATPSMVDSSLHSQNQKRLPSGNPSVWGVQSTSRYGEPTFELDMHSS